MHICSFETHEALKADDAAWKALKLLGVQDFGDGELAELRNCHCTSTLSRPLPKEG